MILDEVINVRDQCSGKKIAIALRVLAIFVLPHRQNNNKKMLELVSHEKFFKVVRHKKMEVPFCFISVS